MTALKYWLWLTSRQGMDPGSALTVLDYFLTPQRVYYADPEEYDLLPIRPAARKGLQDKALDAAERILADCERLCLRIMTIQDADYPQRLRQIAQAPPVLYLKGKRILFDEEAAIAVVGTRHPSGYGEMAATKLSMELSAGGALVLSGMAEGLDTCAVKGALKGGGRVVSVLAGGIDLPFPPENRFLYEDVAAAGALISEYPPGTRHNGPQFPQRNRILSGLSLGVLAVECKLHSGTMSTVNHALEQDRDVFAVPGAIDAPASQGGNWLIQQGAKLVTCGRDILEEYCDRFPAKLASSNDMTPEAAQARLEDVRQTQPPQREIREKQQVQPEPPQRRQVTIEQQKQQFTDDELDILFALGDCSRSADELVEQTQIPARRVLSALTMLQVRQAVQEQAGRRFVCLVELEQPQSSK